MPAHRALLKLAAILFFLLLSLTALGQQLGVTGVVRDADGVVPGATVTLVSGRAAPRTATTNGSGVYSFDGLNPGYYELSFAREGFDTVVRNITLSTAAATVDASLSVSGLAAAVTVVDAGGKATSSRLEIPSEDLPAQLSTISQQLLQQQGVNDMATALRNVSGVQTQVLYGVYEQFTIRGFNAKDAMLVDGMRTEAVLNRQNTQLNNVESIEVLKGPSSALYGGDAVGGVVNVIRKKPQGVRGYDFMYKGGRFKSHQVAGGATGPMAGYSLLYRVDASHSYSNGWRDAGANRLNVSPSLTWLMSERARLTVHQAFNRDNFDGDGGVPVGLIPTPSYEPSRRFSIPDDFALIEDSQTHVLLNAGFGSGWEFRNGFLMRRTSEEYFITEGVYFSPSTNSIPREGLYFHHHRRPYVNQAELAGRFDAGNTRHTLLFGYDYRDFFTRTDVTADGGFYDSYTALNLPDLRETNPSITSFPIVRETYATNKIHAFFAQDQIGIGSKLKINLAGRVDEFDRDRYRIFVADPNTKTGIQTRNQTAYTYRAGFVVAPSTGHQIYFVTNTSFIPVIEIPSDGSELKPRTARSYEGGYRFQALGNRVRTDVGVYHIEQNNLTFSDGLQSVVQAGKQISKGFDADVNADLGRNTHLLVNYGYTSPRFEEFEDDGFDYSGLRPRFTQKHAANLWLNKSWTSGFTASFGVRFVGSMFTNNENTIRLADWTTVAGAVGFRRNSWEWSLNAENLLGRESYFTPSDYSNQVYPGPPINVFSTIRFRIR